MKLGVTLIELLIGVAIIGIVAIMLFGAIGGCRQTVAKSWGGTMTVDLDKGQHVENVTWKQTDLWILTRARREGEVPETHEFVEKSTMGVLQGKVVIMEK